MCRELHRTLQATMTGYSSVGLPHLPACSSQWPTTRSWCGKSQTAEPQWGPRGQVCWAGHAGYLAWAEALLRSWVSGEPRAGPLHTGWLRTVNRQDPECVYSACWHLSAFCVSTCIVGINVGVGIAFRLVGCSLQAPTALDLALLPGPSSLCPEQPLPQPQTSCSLPRTEALACPPARAILPRGLVLV